MSAKQPTFKQRINLLECAAEVVRDHAESTGSRILGEMADVIFTEVEAMKIANKRFELQREARKNRPQRDGRYKLILPHMDRTARIRALNDAFRCGDGSSPVFYTEFTITSGVAAFGDAFVDAAMAAVVAYDAFDEDNDPYGEHDFGAVNVGRTRVFWKIDLYEEPNVKNADGSPAITRVMTIMLANEY